MKDVVIAPFALPGGARSASTDIMAALDAGGVTMSLRHGETIYTEGDPTEHWYEVVRGAVCACKLAADGRRQVVEVHLPGDVFGFEDTGARSLSAEVSAEDVTVLVRRCRRRLDAQAEADPRLARRLRDAALRGLTRAHAHLFLLGRSGAAERVAAFLLEMDERLADQGGRDAASFTLPLTRGDIGDHLGLTVETVSRTLQALRRASLIALPSPRQVRILNRRALENLDDKFLAGVSESRKRHAHPRPAALAA